MAYQIFRTRRYLHNNIQSVSVLVQLFWICQLIASFGCRKNKLDYLSRDYSFIFEMNIPKYLLRIKMAVIPVIRKPGFCVILLVTLIIGLSNIKPGHDFIGWDNYSSYLDPVTNISRTLSSWREYRGLGSLSDSEITDVPRQLFFLAFSIILPNQILDQVYYFMCLLIGVICMYLFAHRIAQRHLQMATH
jgi:hypothetical protein